MIRFTIAAAMAAALLGYIEHTAEACGCLSPPIPVLDDEAFAVNQQSEQIIFEVEEGFVTAHVLIRYAGSPEQFAWIVPVPAQADPSTLELSLSAAGAFSILEQQTGPVVTVVARDVCPESEYYCEYHASPVCGTPDQPDGYVDAGAPPPFADGGLGSTPPVTVIDRQVIGSYETVVFSSDSATAAVAWLNQEGFIVNDTMAPFMQPYADTGHWFVASKLVPGADVSEIRPLRMRFRSDKPVIPLKLTAVATEPHLTVTAYIYGDSPFRAEGRPRVDIDAARISRDPAGRINYPMVLARAIDEAGGDGFVTEYLGGPIPGTDPYVFCCDGGSNNDYCGVGNNGECNCPGLAFDEADCAAEAPDLVEGVALLDELAAKHVRLTRITTRLSAEEMTADPAFIPMPDTALTGRLQLWGEVESLDNCRTDILEPGRHDEILAQQACASVYCGTGECVTTNRGASCSCEAGTVARRFTDLDGEPSITCVPEEAPVDLGAGGVQLPDTCAGIDCGQGTCIDLGGFPACKCNEGAAAALGDPSPAPTCRSIEQRTGTPGAQNYTQSMDDIRVCAPPPPASCGDFGWLERRTVTNPGEACASSQPNPALLAPPDPPTCADLGLPEPGGCGCRSGASGGGLFLTLAGLLWLSRRRRRAA